MPETIETPPAPPAETAAAPEPKGPSLPLVEPRVGQRAKIHLPERKTAGGKPIRVMRPGNPPRPYVDGEVVRWDDHFVALRQEGAVLATEIVEEK